MHTNTAILPDERVLVTLMKLRLNLDYKVLGYRFGVSPFSISTYFKNVVTTIMYIRFQNFVFSPERSLLLKTMP